MDSQRNDTQRPVNPRRRKRSKAQIFREAYLPVIIAGVALLLIVVFIIGSIVRGVQKNRAEEEASIAASIAAQEEQERLDAEVMQLLTQAAAYATGYDYDRAIATLDSFSGDFAAYPELSDRRAQYENEQSQLVAWEDPSQVVNLSFQLLIADLDRAINHPEYAYSFNRNFITTGEFSRILQQLYDNGYVLVSMDDIISDETGVYEAKTLYLPQGKKPVMLTQTNVNYNIYLVDGDGDQLPDQNGGGFASKLILDENGDITCQMVDGSGQTVTGDYDMVPILERFIREHPDFSYRGARALLALTGYNGLFGYRTQAKAYELFGQQAYEDAVAGATQIADKLRALGYDFGCYTYENIAYGSCSSAQIQADLSGWNAEVVPILGQLDTLVFAQLSDISEEQAYSGDKYELLRANGFRYFLGFSGNPASWIHVDGQYVHQGRLMVNGASLAHYGDRFSGIFDPASVLDPGRGEIPY